MGRILKQWLLSYLDKLMPIPPDELIEKRYRKFRAMGVFTEKTASQQKPPSDRREETAPLLQEVSTPERKS